MATATKAKKKAVVLTADEAREKIGDFQKEVAVELPDSVLMGEPIVGFAKRVKEFANEQGIPWPITIKKANVNKQFGMTWNYVNGVGKYRPYYRSVSVLALVGTRPFTDEELTGADGKKALAAKAKADKARAKDEAKYAELKAKLGL